MSEHASDNPQRDAARYVQPELTEARLQRVWVELGERLPTRRAGQRVWAWLGAMGVVACVASLFFVLSPRFDQDSAGVSLLSGAVLETAGDSLSMGLPDGSSLRLDERSRVEVAESSANSVRLRLTRGRIECDVKPREVGGFVVSAEGVEVRVVGTRFSVLSEGDADSRRVEVQVQHGVVEVRGSSSPGEVVRVPAGRSWSQVTKLASVEREKPKAETATSQPPVAAPPKPEVSVERAPSGARELLEEANQLRRAGRAREAAQRYEALLDNHAADARAGLAAFELGRLRMDRFGDMPGAISAFERAMALAPGSGFREDALARVVTAQARSGNLVGCKRAKERYLKSYPEGIHREAVLEQCGGR